MGHAVARNGFSGHLSGRSNLVVWLMRWLLFRLMFLSGSVKLLSHDPMWRSLNAMRFHYWTQPLPTPVAWYMNQLPDWFHQASTAMVFVSELRFRFLFSARDGSAFRGIWLHRPAVFDSDTGNYTFFNFLTIALCLFLFDDRSLAALALANACCIPIRELRSRSLALVAILSGSQLHGDISSVYIAGSHSRLACVWRLLSGS